jgi:hypothetical protein
MIRKFGVEPRGRVFIDKMPLASVQLPLIAKLFPNARILFARRDPRDVILSCFRRRFGMNPSMYQLLTLEGAAAYYDAIMRLAELYRELLPLPQHLIRYESLVEDFETTARLTCAFVGLEWDAAMLDFAAKARTRGISTPSAAQVARGLNREGQGVWRRYREQMAPVLPRQLATGGVGTVTPRARQAPRGAVPRRSSLHQFPASGCRNRPQQFPSLRAVPAWH